MILFVDYDGTLHPSWVFYTGKERVTAKPYAGPWLVEGRILEWILQPYLPRLEIVISSLWARTKGLEVARGMLPRALADRVTGSIWSQGEEAFSSQPSTRYRDIKAWLEQQRPGYGFWLALDDDDRGWPSEERHHLVHSRGTLANLDVQKQLAERLATIARTEVIDGR